MSTLGTPPDSERDMRLRRAAIAVPELLAWLEDQAQQRDREHTAFADGMAAAYRHVADEAEAIALGER